MAPSPTGRPGGHVEEFEFPTSQLQEAAVIDHLHQLRRSGVPFGDIALLVETNAQATRWSTVLQTAGVPGLLLTGYDGTRSDGVKVGTYHRAKGLEFFAVVLPDTAGARGRRTRRRPPRPRSEHRVRGNDTGA